MSMVEVLESVKRIVARWAITETPLTANANIGDTILTVDVSKRFLAGDEIVIRTDTFGEYPLTIRQIIDETHIELTTPIQYNWTVANQSLITKTFYGNFLQAIYLGEPENIPKFPAITIKAVSRDSEWLTIRSTKETFRVDICCYVQSSNQEDTYLYLQKLTDTIQQGLKGNFFPLVGPYDYSLATSNILAGDVIVKVASTNITDLADNRIIIEDKYKAEENRIVEIIDGTTVRFGMPMSCNFAVADGAKIIRPGRFIYNSWPDNIQYGTIFKDTMLKASTISWFAWEEELQLDPPMDTTFS